MEVFTIILEFFREVCSLNYLKEYLSRNKSLIIVSAFILLFSAILGVVFSSSIKTFVLEIFKQMISQIPLNDGFTAQAWFFFQNNMRANLVIILFGFLFSVFSIMSIVLNGLIIGFTYTMVSPIQFVAGIVPHGIFELSAVVLSLSGAFIATKFEVKLIRALFKHNFKEELSNSSLYIKDIIFTIMVVFVLLVIAAVIEAGVTPIILNMTM